MSKVKIINDAVFVNGSVWGIVGIARQFTHDPLRRLLSATGREISNVYSQPSWDLNIRPQDYTATNTYIRRYEYDKIGNIQQLKHEAAGHANQDFERVYSYVSTDNKLVGFTVNSNLYANKYDANGNLLKEGESRYCEWNANDKLAVFKNQAGTSTPSVYTNYFYNAQGERIKKHTRKGTKIVVTFYMDGGMFETSYTKTVGGGIDNNRFYNTIKISDDGALIATIRAGNNVDDNTFAIKYIVGDHLNNSTAVLKTTGTLINREEYYPFGMPMPGRSFNAGSYRYGFQNQEMDNEIKGVGNSVNYKFRMHDPRIGRFFAVDPIANKFPHNSPYAFSENRVVDRIELEGLEVAFIQLEARLQRQTSYIAVTGSYTIGLAVDINGQYLVFQTPTLGIGEGQGYAIGASVGTYPTGNTGNMLEWGMNWGVATRRGVSGWNAEINYSFAGETGGEMGKLGISKPLFGIGNLTALYAEGSYGFKIYEGSVENIDYGYFQETFGLSEDMTNELFETLSFELQGLSNQVPESAPEPVKKAAEAIPTSLGEIINSAIQDLFPDIGQNDNAEPNDER